MKQLNLNLLILLFTVSMVLGCTQNDNAVDFEADTAAIKAMYDDYIQAINLGNLDKFMAVWDDEATRMQPGAPVIIGKEKIRENMKAVFTGFEHEMILLGETIVEVYGNRASGYGTVRLASTPLDGGPAIKTEAKWLDVLKKQDDGSWKIFIDCVNYHPSWSNETSPEELEESETQKSPY